MNKSLFILAGLASAIAAFGAVGGGQSLRNVARAWLLDPLGEVDTITTEQSGMGWADDRVTIMSPAGAFQLGESGDPAEPTIYWPGRLHLDFIEANTITADFAGEQITSGVITATVMKPSTVEPVQQWLDDQSYAGDNGLTYAATGPAGRIEPTTPGRYFPVIDVIDDNDTKNYLDGEIRTAAQVKQDLGWYSGSGSPEGVVTAPVGSLYTNSSGGASTTLYVKTSGTGNTGWTAK